MRRSTLLLITGFVLGFGLGFFVWQKQIGNRLREENARLRALAHDAEKLRTENTKLTRERVEPAELNRLRDGQTELLRLRGQVSQLRQRVNEAQAAASRTNTTRQSDATNESAEPPVETYTAKATAVLGKGQSLVTGGWKTESGNRIFVVTLPTPAEGDNTVLVRSQIVELPEQLVTQLRLDGLKSESAAANANGIFSAEETARLFANLKSQEGVNILSAPQVLTASGMQAQISVTDVREQPNGQKYTTGPIINVTPTVSANKQQVELVLDAQVNLPKGPR
jgi:type II secretory pathway component GspD/PulD (secretin)